LLKFVTSNPRKFVEAQEILSDFELVQVELQVPEIQGKARDVVRRKTTDVLEQIDGPFFVDDTSLEFSAMDGLPGIYINDFLRKLGPEGLFKMLESFGNKRAFAVAWIGYADEKGDIEIFEGRVEGKIVKPRGETEFAWDPIFQPLGFEQTYAEMGVKEKAKISHRKKALEQLANYLAT